MIPRLLKPTALALLAALPALLPAQTDTTAREDMRMEDLSRNQGQWFSPRSKLTVGFRVLNSGATVDFGKLGGVSSLNPIVPASAGAVDRGYSNGSVILDVLRANEVNSSGVQTSTPGGRYQVTTPVVVEGVTVNRLSGDFVSYTPGVTRDWQIMSQQQLLEAPGYVAFRNYSTISEGATARNEQGATAGAELQFSRELGRGGRYFTWGVAAGIALNDISNKAAGTVTSTLRTYTDYYSLNGASAPLNQLDNPYVETVFDTDGDGFANAYETTVKLNAVPDASKSTDVLTAGGATVTGRWQIKGAYFLVKLGPTVRAQITDRFGITASAGFAGAYAGTRYSASEKFFVAELPGVELETQDPVTGADTIDSTETKFLTGYYADLNLEWDTNGTLGLFGGVTAQQLDSYDQKLGDRTAKIDLGSAVGLRGGVSIRF
ncbi:hypothetical protein Verru16b_02445 [Lacunisphaera limnophila]|uniref:Uncharacterized protein n=1 Tax=Lacunisphaera limnophila TaxID=1838286 RepID=A0A1D8AWW4_9BACT|nr:hypothetical protein [Lacunisphaera limnophila]AOS45364.1 hypothetical protein Verru16b_02445 [Lacunisphaera limnophila]